MTRNELIAAVALDFVKSLLYREQEGSLRICVLGFEQTLVRAIAQAVLEDAETTSVLIVKIPTAFDPNNALPDSARSDESITHWRHCRLPEHKRAVLFAASQEELRRNDKSVEKITKIETDTLRALYSSWITQAGLTATQLDQSKRQHLETALQSTNESHAARTIETFSDFVLAISDGVISKGLPIQKAIDHALPALRLPRYAGYFDRISEKKRATKAEWGKIFRRLHTRTRPLLVRENEGGDTITDQLRKNFEDLKERLTDSERDILVTFLDADLTLDEWSKSQNDLVELDWRAISDFFEGITRTTAAPLGKRTVQLFDDEFDDHLDDDERIILSTSFPKEPSEDLQQFFESHREHLAREKKLYSAWEKYIYRNPQTYSDFLVGLLATLHRLRERTRDDELTDNKIVVRIPRGREKSFWRGKNVGITRYFAFRYRGLEELFGAEVTLDFGKLSDFYFPYTDHDLAKVTSGSRDARTLKFEVELDPGGARAKLLFLWEMPVDALATAMADDLLRVANEEGERALLPTANIARQSVSAKGRIQRILLDDINTIRDVTNANDGVLVAPNKEIGDRGEPFLAALSELSDVLDPKQRKAIRVAFDQFATFYTQAIRDWVTEGGAGISSTAFRAQAEAYGALLAILRDHANNDLARERLWSEILRLGVANVGGGVPAAIVTPWHPLRLAEINIKAQQTADLIARVLQSSEADIFRADLLFSQRQLELESDYYPEVCIGFEHQPILLSATETRFDYTLAEPPHRRAKVDGDDALDTEPGVAARAFSTVAEQYLSLLPHERSNFSVVLYNADSKALPSALASELSRKVEQDTKNELQCDLLLTHSQPMRMRRIYEQQNVAVSDDSGSVMASEAARSFLSRLRIGFLDATDLPEDETARASDLVVLQDVISRNAELVWKSAPGQRHPALIEHVPIRWSRRRPVRQGAAATSVYLASPVQPCVGQTYLNALHIFLDGDNARPGDVIPAREVSFKDNDIGDVFRQCHRIGEWVVNFDGLVDRRLLTNNGVHVIRHIHDRHMNRNIVVSTTSKPRLLHALLRERLDRLDPNIVAGQGEDVIGRLINEASVLSGQVVMRAARYGQYANELLGIVLSMRQLRLGLGESSLPVGWYFLDDFASWFGQREEQIADIMAIAPRIEDGAPVLKIAISEAKFVASQGYKAQAKKSARQLGETVARLGRALDPDHMRIDREMWLHRLGDFMIEGMEPFDSAPLNGWDLHRWSDEVRQDNVPIELAGFSHVFVHDDDEYVDAGGSTPLKGMPHCTQQLFDKPRVAAELRVFAGKASPTAEHTAASDESWSKALRSSQGSESVERQPSAKEGRAITTQSRGTPSASQSIENALQSPVIAPEAVSQTDSAAKEELPAEPEPPDDQPLDEASRRWPSAELAAWVKTGRASEEEDEDARKWLETTVTSLQRALRGYDMTAELAGSRLTPNAALVRFRGSDDLTVPKVEKRRQELLTSHAINVINVLAAPREVVILVGRPKRAVLRLQDLWRRRELPPTAPETNTSLLLGARESDGELLYLNVGDGFAGLQPHGPHTLIAGETGSGKGVLVQCLLLDICATNAPTSARIQMIDPKAGIDFPWLRRMPHLDGGDLITSRDEAIDALQNLVSEMERRNRLLADAGVTRLAHYNRKVDHADRLPRIWLFHDELADWMMIDEYRDAVELNANRLGVKARAAGINLVLVTQRPDKDALPMQLRANLTNRLVLKVADKRNSILVLDEPGAERLLGRGHLAARLSGEGEIILAQVPFAEEDEILAIADLIEKAWKS